MNNLSYIITLTAQKTTEIDQVMTQLKELREFVEKGADFPIRLATGALGDLRRDVRNAIRETIMEMEGAAGGGGKRKGGSLPKGGGTGVSGELDSTLGELASAVRDLTNWMRANQSQPRDPKLAGAVNALEFSAAKSGIINIQRAAEGGEQISLSYIRRVIAGLKDVTSKFNDPNTKSFTKSLTDLDKRLDQFMKQGRPTDASGGDKYDKKATEVISDFLKRNETILQRLELKAESGTKPRGSADDPVRILATAVDAIGKDLQKAIVGAIHDAMGNGEFRGRGRGGSGYSGTRGPQDPDSPLRSYEPVSDADAEAILNMTKKSPARAALDRLEAARRAAKAAKRSGQTDEFASLQLEIAGLEQEVQAFRDAGADFGQSGATKRAREQAERKVRDRDSISAKQARSGKRWFDSWGVEAGTQDYIRGAVDLGYVPIAGVSEIETEKFLDRLSAGAPLGMFADKENPVQAQEQFMRELKNWNQRRARDKNDLDVANPFVNATILPPMVVERVSKLLANLSRSNTSELPEEMQPYEKAMYEAYEQLGVKDWLGQAGFSENYRAIRGPANYFDLMRQPTPGNSRSYQDPGRPEDSPLFGDADLLGSTPISLRRQFMSGDLSLEQFQEKMQTQKAWAEANKLTFYQHSRAREGGIHDALLEAEEQLNQLRLRDPDKSKEGRAWQEYETKRDRLSQELMAGGLWVGEGAQWQDTRAGQVGRVINGRPVLLSREEAEAYERNPKGFQEWAAGNLKMGSGDFFGGGAGGGGLGANVPGGHGPGGALKVFVTNFSELTGVELGNGGNVAQFGQLITSLNNTVELLRKSAIVTSPQEAKLQALENEQAIRYKYKVLDAELDRKAAQDKRQDRLDDARARAERRSQRVNSQISKLRSAAGPIDLNADFEATGLPVNVYRQDEGLFLRDLRGILGSYKRANQSVEGLRIAEALNRGAGPDEQLRNLRAQEAGRVKSDTALIQMVQLMKVRAIEGGDPKLFANRGKMDEFLNLSTEKLNIRTLLNESTRTQDDIVGRKEQLSLAEARLGAMQNVQAEVTRLEALRESAVKYNKLEQRIEGKTKLVDEANDAARPYRDLTFEAGNKLLGLGGVQDAARILNQILDRRGILRGEDRAQAIGALSFGTDEASKARIANGEYNMEGALDFLRSIEQAQLDKVSKAAASRQALVDQQNELLKDPANKGIASLDSYDLNNRLTVARGQLTTMFGTKDPAKQDEALARARAEIEGMKNGLDKVTTEGAERLQKLAKALGVSFTSVGDLMQNRLPEVNDKLKKLGDELVQLAAAETNSSSGRQGGFMEGMARKVLQLGQYVGAGAIVYSLTNTIKAAARQVVDFESEIKKIQGVLDTQSPVAARQVAGVVQSSALEYGTDLTQSLRAARVFAQTGMSVSEIDTYTRATLAAQQGAGFEGAQASEFLIASRNIVGSDRANSPFDILDRVSRIEARYAVTAQDLAQAVQRVGSLVTQFQSSSLGGVDAYDTIIGATTAIVEKTRVSGNQAATALRFILSRIAAPEVAQQLQSEFGIKLGGENPGELRPLQDILQDISKEYVKLRDTGRTVEASKLLVTFAGARQANIAAALLGDFGRVQDIAAQSGMSFGDSRIRADEQLNTVAGRAQQLNTAFFSLISNVMETSGALMLMREGLNVAAKGTQVAADAVGTKGGWVSTMLAAGTTFYMANSKLDTIRKAQEAATAAGGAATTVTNLSRLGQAALGVTRFLGGLGLAIGAITLLYQGYKWAADRFNLPGSNYRLGPGDTSSVREQYNEEATAMAARLGISANEMPDITKTVLENIEKRINSNPRYGPGAFAEFLRRDPTAPNNFSRTDVNFTNDLNKAILEEFEKAIPGFSELGDRTERLAMAFDTLRLTAQGMSIEGEAASKRAYDVGERIKQDRAAALESLKGSAGFTYVENALPSLERRLGLNNGFSNIGLVGGASLNQRLREEVAKLNPVGGGNYADSDSQMMTALNRAVVGLFGVRGGVQTEYWNRSQQLWERNMSALPAGSGALSAINALPSSGSVIESLTTGRDAIQLTGQERTALANQRLLVAQLMRNIQDTNGFTKPLENVTTVTENAGENLLKSLVDRAVDGWVEGQRRANINPTAEQVAAIRRGAQEQANRMSTMATVESNTGAAARIRALFLNPYLQYARRQSDITQNMSLLDVSPGYDYQTERASASLELVRNLSSVRVNMGQQVLQDIVQIAAISNKLSQASLLSNLENMGDTAAVRNLMSQNATVGDEQAFENNSRQRATAVARLRTNRDMYEAFAANWPQLWAMAGGDPNDPKATLGRELLVMFEDVISGNATKEREMEFMRRSLEMPKNVQEAINLAQQKYAAEQKVVFDREEARLRMVERYSVVQLDNARKFSMLQAQISYNAGVAGLYERPDLAFGVQSQTFGVRRAEVEAERELALARLEEELRLDPRNLRGQALQIARYDRTSQINQQYRNGIMQTELSQQEAVYNERLRRQSEIATQASQLRQGVAAPFKELLSDFNKIKKGGIPLVVDSLAGTFQNLFAERMMDSLMGANGYLTSSLNNVFSSGAFQTNYHINSAFVQGSQIAANNIRNAMVQATAGTGAAGSSPLAAPGFNMAAGAFLQGGVRGKNPKLGRLATTSTVGLMGGGAAVSAYLRDRANRYLTDPSILPDAQPLPALNPLELAEMLDAEKRQQAKIALAQMTGSYGGAWIGGMVNPGEETYAAQGASIGTALGSAASYLIPGIGPIIGPIVGGILGGLLGGTQKRDKPYDPQLVALDKIERNTREQIDAIENQTELLKPDSRFMNVPAGFLVPNFRPGGLGAGGGVTINVYGAPGQSETLIAEQVAKALQSELGTRGGSFDVRNL